MDNLYSLTPTLSAPRRDTSSLSLRLAVSCSASVVVIVVGRVVLVGFERQSSASNNHSFEGDCLGQKPFVSVFIYLFSASMD